MSVETTRLPHLPAVQGLRGVAAVGVLLSHLYVIEAKYSPDTLLGPWARLGMAGVDLFFVISGFIMVYVTWNAARGANTVGPFLWRRVTRIYPLYWIVSLALLAVWLWRPDIVFASNPDPDIVKSFLLIPQQGEPLLTVGWTLIHEMYFYLVFALILLLPKRWMLAALWVWAIVCVGLLDDFARTSPLARLATNPLTLEFVFGATIAVLYLRHVDFGPHLDTDTSWRRSQWTPVFALVGLAAILALVVYGPVFASDPLAFGTELDKRVNTFGVLACALLIWKLFFKPHVGRIGVWLGDISYSLYLTHVLTLSLVGRLASPLLREGIADNIPLLVVMVGASLAVAHLTYILIERPLIRLFRRRRIPHPSRAAEPASD